MLSAYKVTCIYVFRDDVCPWIPIGVHIPEKTTSPIPSFSQLPIGHFSVSFFVFCLFFFVSTQCLTMYPSSPGTHCVDKADLKLTEIYLSLPPEGSN